MSAKIKGEILRKFLVPLLGAILSLQAWAAEPVLSPDAPQDKPALAATADKVARMQEAMEPYVQEARKTYPDARARFLKGLPPGHNFFITTRLHDSEGRVEQVFVAVTSIDNGTVHGIIYSPIQTVSGFSFRQAYSFSETELVDWLIAKPDGSEEGNVVGKFMDTYEDH
jgi:hypothetical protein